MIHDGRCVTPLVDFLETKANIEALSNLEEGMTAYASDSNEFGAYDGSIWHWSRLDIDYLTGATYVSVQDWTKIVQSAGYFDGGALTAHSDAITAANVGGAGAGSFEVAGDQTAGYPAAATITVSGSTGNDGDYTVKAGGSSHVGGTTTIPVDEAVTDGTADGDIANGRVDGAAIKGFLKITDAALGDTKSFDLAATANLALTDAQTNYIYIDYVSGPRWQVTITRSDIEQYRQFSVGRIYRDGTTLHIVQSGSQLENFVRREHERIIAVRGFERASGGTISETGERYIESTAGVFYLGINEIATTGVDTSGAATFTRHYHSGGVWTSDQKSQICAVAYQYDDGTNLANVTKYGVWWVFVHFDSDLHVVVGRGNYTLAQAQAATVPTTPNSVSDFSTLAAKVIVKNNGTNFASIQSAYEVFFPLDGAFDHNDLGGIQGGTADQYYHTTSAQHAAAFGNKTENTFYAGPATAPAAAGEFRAVVAADIQTVAGIAWTQAHTFGAGLSVSAGQGITLADGVWLGISGNELLTVNAAGNFTFSGIGSVVMPHGSWIGCNATVSWLYDATLFDITTLARVGIGTTAPTELLHIYKSSTDLTDILIESTQNGYGSRVLFVVQTGSTTSFGVYDDGYVAVPEYTDKCVLQTHERSIALVAFGATADDQIQIYTGGRAAANRRITVTKDGNTGFAIAVPLAKVHIDQSAVGGTIPVLILDQGDEDEPLIDYIGTSAASAAKSISSWTTGNAAQGHIRIKINGVTRWMRFYDTPTS